MSSRFTLLCNSTQHHQTTTAGEENTLYLRVANDRIARRNPRRVEAGNDALSTERRIAWAAAVTSVYTNVSFHHAEAPSLLGNRLGFGAVFFPTEMIFRQQQDCI